MGLTRQYLRFVPGPIFGIVASPSGQISLLNSGIYKNWAIVPACENVLIWNYKTDEIIRCFKGELHYVTCLTNDVSQSCFAVGYSDGAVRVYNVKNGNMNTLFQGHKSPVSCLAYDAEGLRLASGGKDTEIVLWDMVGEQGLFRLKGHKGPITKCQFLKDSNVLISSSEDTLLKLWDLDSQHCFKTLVGNREEVWDFLVLRGNRLITGINDADLRVWDLVFKNSRSSPTEASGTDANDDDETLTIKEVGKILTLNEKRTVSLNVDNNERLLGCHGYSKSLQLFRLLTHEETIKKLKKRKKKERILDINCDTVHIDNSKITLSDQIDRLKPIQTEAKIVAFSIETESVFARVAVLLNNNSFAVYKVDLQSKDRDALLWYFVRSPSHRSNVLTLAFSSDSQMLLSASNESAKVWSCESQRCMHTFTCDYALCCTFVTGNNHFIIGTKRGELHIFDLSTQQCIDITEAHSEAVSCLCQTSDQKGITSGSSDKDIKFWDYELIKDENYSETKKRLSLSLARTLKMSEEVLCLKCCPKQKFLAISLLNCNVEVLFFDTLKEAFCLYGHKLPVSCIDISYDSMLLISGSKDKNIKIWNMEFGNCLKSIFAHEDSITCVQFLPKTHMFFSGSKDKKLKQWDADNFQKILTLEGHQSKINAISVSPDGRTVITASHDKSMRIWEKTNEPLVLEEEQQAEREQEADAELTSQEPTIVGETNSEVGLAAKVTVETIKSVEQLIEAIDIHKDEVAKLREHEMQCKATGKNLPLPTVHPLLTAYSLTCPYRFFLKILQKVRTSSLEETLLHMPFNYVIDFLLILTELLARNWEVELCTRCVLFLLRIHLGQILTCRDMVPVISKLKTLLHLQLTDVKNTVGFNMAGLKFLQRQIEESEDVCLFADATQTLKRKSRKRRLINFV